MAYKTNSVVNHPKIKALKTKFDNTVTLAIEKAVGHMQHPEQYPLPGDPKSMERAFYNLFHDAPKKSREALFAKVNPGLNATAAKRKTLYGELSGIDLRSATAVLDQVAALPVPEAAKLTPAEIAALTGQNAGTMAKTAAKKRNPGAAPAPRAIAAGTVDLFADTLTCIKKSEIGKDEIVLEGVVTNGLDLNQAIQPIDLGKFKKGESKTVSTNPIFTFDIIEDSTGSVQNLTALLFLREKDGIKNEELAFKISLVIGAIALALALLALGIAIVGTLLALTSQALFVVMLVSFFTGTALGPITPAVLLLADDISSKETDTLVVDETLQVGDVINRSLNFDLVKLGFDFTKGNYTAALRWVKTS